MNLQILKLSLIFLIFPPCKSANLGITEILTPSFSRSALDEEVGLPGSQQFAYPKCFLGNFGLRVLSSFVLEFIQKKSSWISILEINEKG